MSDTNYSHHDNRTELEKLLTQGKPWFEQNGTLLIYGLAAVLAVAAVVVYMGRQPTGNIQASRDLLLAVTPEDFRDAADAHPETVIGVWARLRQADRLLDNAVSNMFTNREIGVKELDEAESAYKRLADRRDITEEVRERVLIGLARVAETKCDGTDKSTEAAVSAWNQLLKDFPESLLKEHAEDRISQLETSDSKSFYAWFAEQDPKPVDPGMEPGQPQVPEIPANPHAVNPEPSAEGTESAEETPAAEESKKDEPVADASESTDTKDEAQKPAEPEAKPAPTEKPEDSAPPAADADNVPAESPKPAEGDAATEAAEGEAE